MHEECLPRNCPSAYFLWRIRQYEGNYYVGKPWDKQIPRRYCLAVHWTSNTSYCCEEGNSISLRCSVAPAFRMETGDETHIIDKKHSLHYSFFPLVLSFKWDDRGKYPTLCFSKYRLLQTRIRTSITTMVPTTTSVNLTSSTWISLIQNTVSAGGVGTSSSPQYVYLKYW